MKTSDRYVIKTSDLYPVAGKDPNDYDYPLTSKINEVMSYTSEVDP